MPSYTIEVDVPDRQFAPGMQRLTDAVADVLEDMGATESDYTVVTHGPAELTIGWRFRS